MHKLTSKTYDIAIIGGGIHGAGVAQAAAAAGYSVLLLEQNEIGSGTSSRSSKLIHGGLRYLESAQFSLVKECLKERSNLISLAPNLVKLVPFYIPVYKDSQRTALIIRLGLSLYALLGKLRDNFLFSKISPQGWENTDKISTKELICVFQYWDAQTDDQALTNAVMHSARSLGADIISSAKFTHAKLEKNNCELNLIINNQKLTADSRFLVNASGPWVSQTLQTITPTPPITPIDLVQGTHILVDRNQSQGIYYLESPSDKRAVFSMPWKNKTLIGTTETIYNGDPAKVTPTQAEIDYLISIYNHYFPTRCIDESHILSSFAGLRVLPKDAQSVFSRSRDTFFSTYPNNNPKLLSIYGGKLTTYRSTAQKVLNTIKSTLPKRKIIANPSKLKLFPPNTSTV
ncbi:MAG: FAD-dependent oxidoreductase [Gammaproteobacteria bacterium]|nr:FAD-dependent oxidoreductase [Gammaproteobacteria bacterium]